MDYSAIKTFTRFVQYFLTSTNGKGHGVHSPFIFQFITGVLNDRKIYPEYGKVEALRGSLKKDSTMLTIEDYGAGSVMNKKNRRTVSSIARHAAKPKKYGQLLFRMIRHYQPKTILELGTSLGITTCYLASAQRGSRVYTLEGAGAVAARAAANFKTLQLGNITLVEGNFDVTLDKLLDSVTGVDFAFIDGNHRKEPTLRYFHQLLAKSGNDSILVFDDIHWSAEMEDAWRIIRAHPSVRCSIDLFQIGILFFRKEFHENLRVTVRF